MRSIFTLLMLLMSFFSSSYAEESSEVSALISKIKTAEAPQRRLLINELKLKLREENQQTKAKAMAELRNSLKQNSNASQIKQMHKKGYRHNSEQQKQIQNLKIQKQNNIGQKHKGMR